MKIAGKLINPQIDLEDMPTITALPLE